MNEIRPNGVLVNVCEEDICNQLENHLRVCEAGCYKNSTINDVIGNKNDSESCNSIVGLINRYTEKQQTIQTYGQITGNGATTINIVKFTGNVRIVNQGAEIFSITNNDVCTNVYIDAFDGSVSVPLTADGIDLSSAPVGSFFVKDQIASEPFTLSLANQVRAIETVNNKRVGYPFNLTGKSGVDNFIRFRFIGNESTDFIVKYRIDYILFNGASLEIAP